MSAQSFLNVTFIPPSTLPVLAPMALTLPEYAPQDAYLGMALGTTTVREGPSATPPQLAYALSWAGASINAPFPFRGMAQGVGV